MSSLAAGTRSNAARAPATRAQRRGPPGPTAPDQGTAAWFVVDHAGIVMGIIMLTGAAKTIIE
jgi:hypothetical protein